MSYQAPITQPAGPAARSIEVIAATLEAHTGQRIAQNRIWRVETSLKPLLRDHGLCSLDALANRLAEGGDARLIGQVIDALLNQETSFFVMAAFWKRRSIRCWRWTSARHRGARASGLPGVRRGRSRCRLRSCYRNDCLSDPCRSPKFMRPTDPIWRSHVRSPGAIRNSRFSVECRCGA